MLFGRGRVRPRPRSPSPSPSRPPSHDRSGKWASDGNLALVRDVGSGGARLELPAGHALYETKEGHISHARISPRGDLIAFVDHPSEGNDSGAVAVVDRASRMRLLTKQFLSVRGLAWARDEVWFTGAEKSEKAVCAVTISGRLRLVHRSAASFTLFDVSGEGSTLLGREEEKAGVLGVARGETEEKDLSWLDQSTPHDISADGKFLLLSEESAALGGRQVWGVRKMDGSAVVSLGEIGDDAEISPEGRRILALARLLTIAMPSLRSVPARPAPWSFPAAALALSASEKPVPVAT